MPADHRLDHQRFLVREGARIRLADFDPAFSHGFSDKDDARRAMLADVSALVAAQDLLWASAEYAVLIIFQAMDAAGKDGTIKHVMSGLNPQGCAVYPFRAPSDEECRRHFLWRAAKVIPAYGHIAIFNRSYYEEVLVVRVRPEFLERQSLPPRWKSRPLAELWRQRYADIRTFEDALARSGVCILKFFLHVSRDEQRKRLLARLDDPRKHWKFDPNDVRERERWDEYMTAYEDMLNATSTDTAPWYVIPADKKWFMRAAVADVIASRIAGLELRYPLVSSTRQTELEEARRRLEAGV
jgi:PPK2 family polyphosphate:nucleotide phosphotransferase